MSGDILDILGGEAPLNPAETRIANVKEILARSAGTRPEIFAENLTQGESALIGEDTAPAQGGVKYHHDIIQGTDEWLALRTGILTASEMKLIITPTLKVADSDKCRAHVYEIAAQRITGYTEPCYISDDMLRGYSDEVKARILYGANYAPVEEIGFITSDKFGFTIGYSPDGLVGKNGAIECKSRRQKYQIQTIVENVKEDTIPPDYTIQIQTGMMVAELEWCDFISYSGGMPMVVVRVYPIPKVQAAIRAAAVAFEEKVCEVVEKFRAVQEERQFLLTEREIEQEIMI